ncbi:MAG TPA: CHAP domain-containing protein [Fibrobacteria bacterium]|nr:CHAP domain-containing protein [Fibrobacteria bacterium]
MEYPKRLVMQGESDKTLVKAVQAQLNASGCGPLPETGTFGPKTAQAVKLFQSTHRDQNGNPLAIDGKVGAITWAILFGIEYVPVSNGAGSKLLSKALREAASQDGVMERPPGSNSGPEVDAYLASVGLGPGQYWCASFVYWCFQRASRKLGVPNPLIKTGGCLDHWNRTKGKKIKTADATANPGLLLPGQIFIINHGGGNGHTGMVEKVEGGFIDTIEGNSNPEGGSNGIGVFRLQRKISQINQGFIQYK